MTSDGKLWQLTGRLLEKTQNRSIKWEATAQKDTFQTAFPKFTVEVTEGPDRAYEIAVHDELGREIERGSAASIFSEHGSLLQDLYNAARRSAVSTDEALDELLAELDEAGAA
jgi:hypothetical protein